MSEFKFSCPSCGQKIKVDATAAGRQFDCPACQSKLVVPAAPKKPGELAPATLLKAKSATSPAKASAPSAPAAPKGTAPAGTKATPGTSAKPSVPTAAVKAPARSAMAVPKVSIPGGAKAESETSAKGSPLAVPAQPRASEEPAKTAPVPTAAPAQAPVKPPRKAEPIVIPKPVLAPEPGASSKPASPAKVGAKPAPTAPTPVVKAVVAKPGESMPDTPADARKPGVSEQRVQIAVLTPTLKREIIRSARRRIAAESHWMPRITPEREYAYAAKEENGKLVRVGVTDPEATRFSILGVLLLEFHLRKVTRTAAGRQELLDQDLIEALRQVAGDEAGEQEVAPGELPSSGKQVPPVSHAQCLEALDVLEERYSREASQSEAAAQGRIEDVRLSELMRNIELKKRVSNEELCTALANELKDIHERLDALERPPGK